MAEMTKLQNLVTMVFKIGHLWLKMETKILNFGFSVTEFGKKMAKG